MLTRHGAAPAVGAAVNAWVVTVSVDDCKASFAKALELGATEALPIRAVPGVGWNGYLLDPDNNLLGLMQSDPDAA